MKKETIIEALEKANVQLEEEQLKAFIKAIQVANGYDIEKAKGDYDAKVKELADLQEKFDAEVKSHEKGGEKYIDSTELEELRKFKADTIDAQNKKAQNTAIKELLSKDEYKFDKKAIELLTLVAKDKGIKFNDKNEIENADEFIKTMTTDFKDYIITEQKQGANPQNTVNQTQKEPDTTLASAIAEKYNQKK